MCWCESFRSDNQWQRMRDTGNLSANAMAKSRATSCQCYPIGNLPNVIDRGCLFGSSAVQEEISTESLKIIRRPVKRPGSPLGRICTEVRPFFNRGILLKAVRKEQDRLPKPHVRFFKAPFDQNPNRKRGRCKDFPRSNSLSLHWEVCRRKKVAQPIGPITVGDASFGFRRNVARPCLRSWRSGIQSLRPNNRNLSHRHIHHPAVTNAVLVPTMGEATLSH